MCSSDPVDFTHLINEVLTEFLWAFSTDFSDFFFVPGCPGFGVGLGFDFGLGFVLWSLYANETERFLRF